MLLPLNGWNDEMKNSDAIISLKGDSTIVLKTIVQVFKSGEVVRSGTASDIDYSDWLLERGEVTQEEYDKKQRRALKLLNEGC